MTIKTKNVFANSGLAIRKKLKSFANNAPALWKNSKKRIRANGPWFSFLMPAVIVYTVFMAFPLFNSMRLSFYSGTGLVPEKFVGFQNYIDLFFNPIWRDQFFNALKNTSIFFGINMVAQNTLGLVFAVFLASALKGQNIYRTIIFIPATLSILVSGFLWRIILDPSWGAVNNVLNSISESIGGFLMNFDFFTSINTYLIENNLDIFSGNFAWLSNEHTALPVVTLVSCWQWIGLPTMMFLAGLQSIPEELYEAADIDGASSWQVFRHIKLPLLMPVVGIVTILTFVGNFNAFDIVYAMEGANGAPSIITEAGNSVGATDLLGTMFYRVGIAGRHPVAIPNMGIGAAIATMIFLILFIGVGSWMYLSRKKPE